MKTFENYTPPDWNDWFLRIAYEVSYKSKDQKTKIGSVIVKDKQVIKIGYNGFPAKIDDNIKERHERPAKYEWTVHSEANAICAAAKYGAQVNDSQLFTLAVPCRECFKLIISSGIKEVFYHSLFQVEWDQHYRDYWKNHVEFVLNLSKESGVDLICIKKILNKVAYLDGEIIDV